MHFIVFLGLASVQSLSVSGGYAAVVNDDGGQITVVDNTGEGVFTLSGEPGESFSYLIFRDLRIFCLSSRRGLLETDILTGVTSAVSSRRTGAPWVDSEGAIWYTRQGSLYCGDEVMNSSISAFHVSVENGVAVYTDRNDFLRILNLETGRERVVQGYRFYAPTALMSGDVIAPTLTGEIVYLPADGSLMVVGSGEQPVWSSEHRGIFYCVSTDDGHELTGADLWFVVPGEQPVRITDTADVFETGPECSGGLLWYQDAATGSIGTLNTDDLSL